MQSARPSGYAVMTVTTTADIWVLASTVETPTVTNMHVKHVYSVVWLAVSLTLYKL